MTTQPVEELQSQESWRRLQDLRRNIEQVFYGKREAVDQMIVALLPAATS